MRYKASSTGKATLMIHIRTDNEELNSADDLTYKQCLEIAYYACANHMWINAMSCIRPTDELKMQIGEQVLRWLDQKENLLPSGADHESNMAKLTPVLYLSINKS